MSDTLYDPEDSVELTDPHFATAGPARRWLYGVAAASLVGAVFAAVSTSDFIAHLDRQVHSIHCSLVPGTGAKIGESGCRTVMMSPYSSLFRESLWGGLPISLLALAVFSYLVMKSTAFSLRPQTSRRESKYLLAATLLPVLMSVIYGTISTVQLDALCKQCLGIYIASFAAFGCALAFHAKSGPDPERMSSPSKQYGLWFAEGVAYVAILAALYPAFAPKAEASKDGCGILAKTNDPKVLVPYAESSGKTTATAVIDPLCSACKAFDGRLEASGQLDKLDLKMVMFPLDPRCNWMVKDDLHPGSCLVAEAILCEPEAGPKILSWAFENQESLLEQGKTDQSGLRRRIGDAFPSVKGCLGGSKAKNLLTRSLKWAVANAIPVMTPQLFVGDRRLCDEDTDLGLEYSVAQMLQGGAK